MKKRIIKICPVGNPHFSNKVRLHIEGAWLVKLGFTHGNYVSIDYKDDKLIIEKL